MRMGEADHSRASRRVNKAIGQSDWAIAKAKFTTRRIQIPTAQAQPSLRHICAPALPWCERRPMDPRTTLIVIGAVLVAAGVFWPPAPPVRSRPAAGR
jgi:hypothetical protein